ncbi:hypothetical protein [Cupriavidus necator]|uniref:hypothetical protein n=1 Tax=Cupriavidus necator TaxID=106590 RepID=UPI0027868208|nr:hypothetical protein [Cupriavidus necator]MDQ0140501.1 hypothetical protein [Cupriavidus necator]
MAETGFPAARRRTRWRQNTRSPTDKVFANTSQPRGRVERTLELSGMTAGPAGYTAR